MPACSRSGVARHGNCTDHNAQSKYVARSCYRWVEGHHRIKHAGNSTLVLGEYSTRQHVLIWMFIDYVLSINTSWVSLWNCLVCQLFHVSRQVRQLLSTTGPAKHGISRARLKPSLCQPSSGFATAECWETMKHSAHMSCRKTATFR